MSSKTKSNKSKDELLFGFDEIIKEAKLAKKFWKKGQDTLEINRCIDRINHAVEEIDDRDSEFSQLCQSDIRIGRWNNR